MESLGLRGKYTRDTNGMIQTSDFTDLEGAKFAYVTDLVNAQIKKEFYNQSLFKNLNIYYFTLKLCKHKNISHFIS